MIKIYSESASCSCTNEIERLRYQFYSELAESKKEIDTLRADLNYFNATSSIFKSYFLEKEGA